MYTNIAASLSLPAAWSCFPTTDQGPCISPDPLLMWTQVGVVCAALLIVEALVVAVVPLVRGRSRRLALLAPLTAAAGCALLAYRAWAAYQYYATLDVGRSPPFGVIPYYASMIQKEIATVQTLGWLMVATTVTLLALGAWLLIRSLRSAPTGASRQGAAQHAVG
jgi:hypothetical protein